MHFEFVKTRDLTPAVHDEIEACLDRQSNSHPFQFPRWTGGGNDDEGDRSYCAILREDGEIRWFAHCGVTFPAGKWLSPIRTLTIHRGPACDDADLMAHGLGQLVEKGKKLGFASIKIAPEWVEQPDWTVGSTLSGEGWQLLPENRSSLRVDLGPSFDELLRSFRDDTKLNIRRSERQEIAIRLAQDERDIQEFQHIYFEMAEKKNFVAEEPASLSHALRWVVSQKDRGALFLASKEATPLGGVLVVRAAKRSWGVYSATAKDTRLRAGHVLQWSAIRWAKEHGCAEYDLGGYREGTTTGPASFKRGFSRDVVQFSPAYEYALNRPLCSILDLVTRVRSKWGAG
jgi:lipid II:glycine glycyltransferase (peptidoglycan interpeptide bridge formation enzyme)